MNWPIQPITTRIIEDSTSTKPDAKSFEAINSKTKIDVKKSYGKSDSELALNVVSSRSAQKSAYVYGNLTLEELISRHEEIQIENVYLHIQLADANTRIEELEQCLEEQGLMVHD